MLERELQGAAAADEADPFVLYLYGLVLTDRHARRPSLFVQGLLKVVILVVFRAYRFLIARGNGKK